ncbi:MAG TPA: hypothetical protein VEI96_10555 [Thermodesulfovibrionales bacterium]|nr:hypothetical protein [Thermodesulfovibrionales bacterium]
MKKVGHLLLLLTIIPVVLLLACATSKTKVTKVWVDQEYQGQQFRKMLVVGPSQTQKVRVLFEDEFVKQLRKYGIDAIPSYTVFPQETKVDKEILEAKVAELKADAVLLTRIVFREMGGQTRSANDIPEGYYYRMPDMYGRSFSSTGEIFNNAPDNQLFMIETNLYDAKTEKLIWTATSYTQTSGDPRNAIPSYIEIMTDNLHKENLLR